MNHVYAMLRILGSDLTLTANIVMMLIALVALVVALSAARAAWKTYKLAEYQYALAHIPRVEARTNHPRRKMDERGIMVANYGQGIAVGIRLELQGMAGVPMTGGPSPSQVTTKVVRDLFPHDRELLPDKDAQWSQVWGAIHYEDTDGNQYTSNRSNNEEKWTHERVSKRSG